MHSRGGRVLAEEESAVRREGEGKERRWGP